MASIKTSTTCPESGIEQDTETERLFRDKSFFIHVSVLGQTACSHEGRTSKE